MPSQKQLQWSELKVGLTVLIASITLGILILLMSGTGGILTKKITLISYFDNAGGLREGAPVRLQGVDIGNISGIRVVSDPARRLTPVEIIMKVNTKYRGNLRKDSVTLLSTAGVLGETYIDIDSSQAHGPEVQEGDVLATRDTPANSGCSARQPKHIAKSRRAGETGGSDPGLCRKRPGIYRQSDLRSQPLQPA